MGLKATVRPPGSGERNGAFGLPRAFKVESQDCDGAFAVFLEEVPPNAGPPMHIHHREHETFVVLEGNIRFHCEGDESVLGPAGVICIPPGARHTFKNAGDTTARCVVTLTPGGGEGFFKAVEAEGLVPPDDMPRIVEIAAEFGLEFVGPPLE